jgi:hypothetical protein
MPHQGVRLDQSERASPAVRLRCEVGRSAECTVPAVAHQMASGMGITGTALGRRKQSNFESSLNRYDNKCPLSGAKRTSESMRSVVSAKRQRQLPPK